MLKVAIIGAGKMGFHHAKAIQRVDGARLIAVVDPFLDRERWQKVVPGEIELFTDSAAMLENVRPEVVHITTPPGSHAMLAELALKHFAHVYVEKPFAINQKELERVCGTAENVNRKICAGHQLLFEYPAGRIMELLPIIGDTVHIESYFSFRQVRRNITRIDQLLDVLPHPVYLLLHFMQHQAKAPTPAEIQFLHTDPEGECRAVISSCGITGILIVSLKGRPVESFLRIVGSNGSIHADFVLGTIRFLPGPGASGPSVLMNPFKTARQGVTGSLAGISRKIFVEKGSYPGLQKLIGTFYDTIVKNKPSPISIKSIRETVKVFEAVDLQMRAQRMQRECDNEKRYLEQERNLQPVRAAAEKVLVTGGTGFLGRHVLSVLRGNGWPVRCLSRRIPDFADRIAGVDYVKVDLGSPFEPGVFKSVGTIVHCAAETAGDRKDHERNSIGATRQLIESSRRHGIARFVHISSVAVLKNIKDPEGQLNEQTAVDFGNSGRGPYVWGKAESERLLTLGSGDLLQVVKIIRLAPLVDFNHFQAPGRLGREVGQLFVAVGNRRDRIGLCDVLTAAKVIRYYVEKFDDAPAVLNLVQSDVPTRGELVRRLLKERPDLRVKWLPLAILRTISPLLVALQRIVFPSQEPIDLHSAFASVRYETSLAESVIARANVGLGNAM